MSEERNAVAASDRIKAGEWIILDEPVRADKEDETGGGLAMMFGVGMSCADRHLMSVTGMPMFVRRIDWPHAQITGRPTIQFGGIAVDLRRWKWRVASQIAVDSVYRRPSLLRAIIDTITAWRLMEKPVK